MIPLTTKLPAICSLLRRVLEMEEKATPGPWETDDMSHRFVWPLVRPKGIEIIKIYTGNDQDASLISLSRNITKPQATALLGDITAWQEVIEYAKSIHRIAWGWDGDCGAFARADDILDTASARLQSIADAFTDELFQDSSRRLTARGLFSLVIRSSKSRK